MRRCFALRWRQVAFSIALLLDVDMAVANPAELNSLLKLADQAMNISGRSNFCAPLSDGKVSCSVDYLAPSESPCKFEIGSRTPDGQVGTNWDGSWQQGTIVRRYTVIDFSSVNPQTIRREMLGPIYFPSNDQYVHLAFDLAPDNQSKMFVEVKDGKSEPSRVYEVNAQFYFNSPPSYESLIAAGGGGGFSLSFKKEKAEQVIQLIKTLIEKCQ